MDPSLSNTLLEQFLSLARSHGSGERDIVECNDERWTYSELDVISTSLAGQLLSIYGPRPVVAIVSENHPYVLAMLLATWKLGGIVAPIDYHSPKEILSHMLLDIKPTCALVPDGEALTRNILKNLSVPLLPFDTNKTTMTSLSQEFIDQPATNHLDFFAPAPNDIALYLHTSSASTVSNIKCVPLTHRNIIAGSRARLGWWKRAWPHQDFNDLRVLGWSPWSHIIGISHDLGAATLLTAGCYHFALVPSSYSSRLHPVQEAFNLDVASQLLESAIKRQASAFAGVPWVLEGFMNKWKDADSEHRTRITNALTSFKVFGSGGAATSDECLTWAKEVGLPLVLDIGMTELGGPLFHGTVDGTIGWTTKDCLLPDSELVIVHEDGSRSSTEGELLVSSSIISRGYLKSDNSAFSVSPNGRVTLRTGDIYQQIDDDHIIWKGRKEDFIQMNSGETLDPREIEKVLDQCAAIHRSCVVGDEFLRGASHFICAIVELSPSDTRAYQLSLSDVTRAIGSVNRSLPPPLRISWSRVLILNNDQQLPFTKKGAIFRKRLEDLFGAQLTALLSRTNQASRKSPTPKAHLLPHTVSEEEARDVVCSVVSEALKLSFDVLRSNPTCTFAELGMDSTMATTIVTSLNRRLRLALPLNTCHTYIDLSSLSQAICAELGLIVENNDSSSSPKRSNVFKGQDDVVIVGQALRLPGDINTPKEFWEALVNKREDIISSVPEDRWDHASFLKSSDPSTPDEPCDITLEKAGFIDLARFDHSFFGISSAEAFHVSPNIRLTLEIAFEALENANIPLSRIKGGDMGIFVAAGMDEGYIKLLFADKGWGAYTRFYGTGVATSTACGRLSYLLDVHGPSFTVDTACSSGLIVLDQAARYIQSGQGESAVVCGANTHTWPGTIGFLSAQKMTSPNSRCATFTDAADGYVPSEGAAAIVLKSRSAAIRDGDTILAVVRSTVSMHDGRSQGLVAPNVKAQIAMQRSLLEQAALDASQIDFIEAHGTGTSLGDLIEIQGINEVFRSSHSPTHPLVVGAAKTCIGHTETVSGLIGVLKVISSFSHHAVPGLVHLNDNNMNPSLDCSVVPILIPSATASLDTKLGNQNPLRAMILSNGFAGSIAGTILEEPLSEADTSNHFDDDFASDTVSIGSEGSCDVVQGMANGGHGNGYHKGHGLLNGHANASAKGQINVDGPTIDSDHVKDCSSLHSNGTLNGNGSVNGHERGTAYKANGVSTPAPLINPSPQLFAISAKSFDALKSYIQIYLIFCRDTNPSEFRSICHTTCIGREHYRYRFACVVEDMDDLIIKLENWLSSPPAIGTAVRNILFGFPGQGSQYQGMAYDLATQFPVFKEILHDTASKAAALTGYPILPFLLQMEYSGVRNLSESDVAQVCIFVYQYAVCRWLEDLRIYPAAVLGHSFGEIAAAVVSGALTFQSGLEFVVKRAEVFRANPQVPAGMAAVAANQEVIQGYLNRLSLNDSVVIAVFNGEESHVLSGYLEAIDAVISAVKADGLKATKLAVNQAFHSPCISSMLPVLAQWFDEEILPRPLEIPFFSTALGSEVPKKGILDTQYWVDHAKKPVQFTKTAALAIANPSIDIILDIGPQPFIWSNMQSPALSSKVTLGLSGKRGKNQATVFLSMLATLFERGQIIEFSHLFAKASVKYTKTNLPTYPFQRTHNYPAFLPSRNGPTSALHVGTPSSKLERHFIVDQALCDTLKEHRIEGRRVVPGAALADFFARPATTKSVQSIRFHQPLVVKGPDDSVIAETDQAGSFVLTQGGSKLCSGVIALKPSIYAPQWTEDESIPDRILNKARVYACFKNVQFGVPFRNIHDIKIWKTHADALISIIETQNPAHDRIRKLDACMHMFGAIASTTLPQLDEMEGAFLPTALDRFTLHTEDLPSTFICRYQLPVTVGRNSQVLSVAVQVFSLSGQLLLTCEKYSVAFIPAGVVIHETALTPQSASWFQHNWTPSPQTFINPLSPPPKFKELLYLGIGPQPHILRTLKETASHTLYVELSTVTRYENEAPSSISNTFRGTDLSVILDITAATAKPGTDFQSSLCQQVLSFMKLLMSVKVQISSFVVLSSQSLSVDLRDDKSHFINDPQHDNISLGAIIQGMLRVFRRETGLDDVAWGLDLPDLSQMQSETIKDIIIQEVESRRQGLFRDTFVAYRYRRMENSPVRLVPTIKVMSTVRASIAISGTGVIVGMGSIGIALAGGLISSGCEAVVFFGRRQATAKSILAEFDVMPANIKQRCVYRQVDVCDSTMLKAGLSHVQAEFGTIKHIIHTAAVVNDATIPNLSSVAFEEVLRPKVLGSWNLHVVSQDMQLKLDSFVLLSSTNVLVGNPGQVAYVSANSYLDYLATLRHNAGLPATSLQLGAWESKLTDNLDMTKSFALLMSHKQGIPLILQAMMVKNPLQIIADFDIPKLSSTPAYAKDPFFATILPASPASVKTETPKVTLSKSDVNGKVVAILRKVLELRPSENLELENSLNACGADSISFAQIRGIVLKDLEVDIPMMFLSDTYSISDIIQYTVDKYIAL